MGIVGDLFVGDWDLIEDDWAPSEITAQKTIARASKETWLHVSFVRMRSVRLS